MNRRDYKIVNERPYFFCSEDGRDKTIAGLEALTVDKVRNQTVHIGFSVWFNYDLIAAQKPKYALLCDINQQALDCHFIIMQLLKECSDIESFCQKLTDKESKNDLINKFVNKGLINREHLDRERHRKDSWLHTKERFIPSEIWFYNLK